MRVQLRPMLQLWQHQSLTPRHWGLNLCCHRDNTGSLTLYATAGTPNWTILKSHNVFLVLDKKEATNKQEQLFPPPTKQSTGKMEVFFFFFKSRLFLIECQFCAICKCLPIQPCILTKYIKYLQ